MGSDFFNGGNADGGKIDIKAKTIKVDTVQRWEWCSSPSICSTI